MSNEAPLQTVEKNHVDWLRLARGSILWPRLRQGEARLVRGGC